ncbi:MAG TPA: response regulator [Candidatus Acidoferrum sp.]|jgi:CheY-like chemotaxis protein|nr:response regulator [Candidatus Acidoferrum sp.]
MTKPLTILVAEDDSSDALLLKLAFSEAEVIVPMNFVRDGMEAMDYLRGVPPFDDRAKYPLPDLLVLDLKMPRMDGFEVLTWLRQQPGSERITVAVLSGTTWPADIQRAYALGADFCLNKLFGFRQLVNVVERMAEKWSLPLPAAPTDQQPRLPSRIPRPGV